MMNPPRCLDATPGLIRCEMKGTQRIAYMILLSYVAQQLKNVKMSRDKIII